MTLLLLVDPPHPHSQTSCALAILWSRMHLKYHSSLNLFTINTINFTFPSDLLHPGFMIYERIILYNTPLVVRFNVCCIEQPRV